MKKIRIYSDSGDLPEGLSFDRVYYTVSNSPTEIKVATTFSNAINNVPIELYGGDDLRVESRVSDKSAGEFGHPIQWDLNQNQWFLHVETGSNLYPQIQTKFQL